MPLTASGGAWKRIPRRRRRLGFVVRAWRPVAVECWFFPLFSRSPHASASTSLSYRAPDCHPANSIAAIRFRGCVAIDVDATYRKMANAFHCVVQVDVDTGTRRAGPSAGNAGRERELSWIEEVVLDTYMRVVAVSTREGVFEMASAFGESVYEVLLLGGESQVAAREKVCGRVCARALRWRQRMHE